MQKHFDRRLHAQLAEQLMRPASVGHCLLYDDMMVVSPAFDRFARAHFSQVHGSAWPDLCPAYALALMTHRTYQFPQHELEMETLWEELALSNVDWRRAKSVVVDAWLWLDSQRRVL